LIDREAFEGVDFIIHLAGANIGEKRWTRKRKKEIIKSRVDSARFLHKTVIDNGIHI
jgi:NAD dependent epimerase/dehydratase family enzyme